MSGGARRTVTTIAMTGLAAVFAVTLLVTVSFGLAGIWFVDVARSYTSGASYYSRYQKNAVLALLRYGENREEADFAAYRESIAVPLADREARPVADCHENLHLRLAQTGLFAGRFCRAHKLICP
ncbi:MAG: hypothetical protein ACK4ZN_11005 [Oceanibaculum sp.]